MTMYIISVVITLVANVISNKLIRNELESMGYIVKSKRSSKLSTGIAISLNFIPFLNLILSILNTILTCVGLCNEEFLLKVTREKIHDPENVIVDYKRTGVKKEVLKDAFTLDGANEKDIKDEFKKLSDYTNFSTQEKGWLGTFLDEDPIYNENDYNNALALKLAKEFINEIETTTELSKKQKKELLSLCKQDFLDEIKGKDSTKSDSRILKLVNKDIN